MVAGMGVRDCRNNRIDTSSLIETWILIYVHGIKLVVKNKEIGEAHIKMNGHHHAESDPTTNDPTFLPN